MSILCEIGWHRARPIARWNDGYYFSSCGRCGRSLVRTTFRTWHVPRGFQIVWDSIPRKTESSANSERARPEQGDESPSPEKLQDLDEATSDADLSSCPPEGKSAPTEATSGADLSSCPPGSKSAPTTDAGPVDGGRPAMGSNAEDVESQLTAEILKLVRLIERQVEQHSERPSKGSDEVALEKQQAAAAASEQLGQGKSHSRSQPFPTSARRNEDAPEQGQGDHEKRREARVEPGSLHNPSESDERSNKNQPGTYQAPRQGSGDLAGETASKKAQLRSRSVVRVDDLHDFMADSGEGFDESDFWGDWDPTKVGVPDSTLTDPEIVSKTKTAPGGPTSKR